MLQSAGLLVLLVAAPQTALLIDGPLPSEADRANLPAAVSVFSVGGLADQSSKQWLEKARAACQQGEAAAVSLEHTLALSRFEDAMGFYARALPSLLSTEEVGRCAFEQGAAWVNAGQEKKAQTSFVNALTLDPQRIVDKNRDSPLIIAAYNAARKAVERRARGSLTLSGSPAGADIVMDGRHAGALPLSLSDLASGQHWFLVRAPGFIAFSTRTTLASSANQKREVFLTPSPGATPAERAAAAILSARGSSVSDQPELAKFAERYNLSHSILIQASGTIARVVDHRALTLSQPIVVSGLKEALSLRRSSPPAQTPLAQGAAETSGPREVVPVGAAPSVARRDVHPVFAILPFGIGQFAERRPLAGSLLLTSQVLPIATNLVAFFVANSFRMPDGPIGRAEQWKRSGGQSTSRLDSTPPT